MLGAALSAGCGAGPGPPAGDADMTADEPALAAVERVRAARSAELLALPGVSGVALGLLEDGRTPCLLVLVEASAAAERVPPTLDGQPVRVEATGPIRPLGGR